MLVSGVYHRALWGVGLLPVYGVQLFVPEICLFVWGLNLYELLGMWITKYFTVQKSGKKAKARSACPLPAEKNKNCLFSNFEGLLWKKKR